jgi:aspartokinase/homoserine dehydrogenase 1
MLLSQHIAIVTPNKRAQSGTLARYKSIKTISEARHVPFLFETSVGAGLPVISTLQDLIKSGDRILRIEGILSGTLGYLCTELMQGVQFSKAVREAQRKGYTEPDPRDDLGGMDVARKILILARESGYSLELSDVEIESLVPSECRSSNSISHFMEELHRADERMHAIVMEAKRNEGRLCYMASFSPDKGASTKLTVLYPDHPFSHIRGSDNIIAFTTDRYQERPLVVQGPGAGAEVTAAGVFADIVRIAQMSSSGLRSL